MYFDMEAWAKAAQIGGIGLCLDIADISLSLGQLSVAMHIIRELAKVKLWDEP